MSHPAVYWRNQHQKRQYIGIHGTIVNLTQQAGSSQWAGIIQLIDEKITAAIISISKPPQIGDTVIGVLRIIDNNGTSGLIEYGIKFQLLEDLE